MAVRCQFLGATHVSFTLIRRSLPLNYVQWCVLPFPWGFSKQGVLLIGGLALELLARPTPLLLDQLADTGRTRQILRCLLVNILYRMPDLDPNVVMREDRRVLISNLVSLQFGIGRCNTEEVRGEALGSHDIEDLHVRRQLPEHCQLSGGHRVHALISSIVKQTHVLRLYSRLH